MSVRGRRGEAKSQQEMEQARVLKLINENNQLKSELIVASAIIEALSQGLSPEVVAQELSKRNFRRFEWLGLGENQ